MTKRTGDASLTIPLVRRGLRWGPVVAVLLFACGAGGIKPIEIYPEDMCSNCKMAISDHRFASEFINDQNEVFKFDDIGCMMKFRAKHDDLKIAATYMKDYYTKEWLPYERTIVIETDIETPMGSGKVAFSDSTKAKEFQQQHPASKTMSVKGSGMDCCSSEKD